MIKHDKCEAFEARIAQLEKEIADRDQYGDAYLWSVKFQRLANKLEVATKRIEQTCMCLPHRKKCPSCETIDLIKAM